MVSFDFGVELAFWLTIASALLCIYYGVVNWNTGSEMEIDDSIKQWAEDEDKIEEVL